MSNSDRPFLKLYKDLKDLKLSPVELIIYCQITEFINNTGTCYMTDAQFADEYNISSKTVSRTLQSLEDKKLIKRYTTTQTSKRVRLLTLYDETVKMTDSPTSETDNLTVSKESETDKMTLSTCTNPEIQDKMSVSTPQETTKNNMRRTFCPNERDILSRPYGQNDFIKDKEKINIKDNQCALRIEGDSRELFSAGFSGKGTLKEPFIGTKEQIKYVIEHNPYGANFLVLQNGYTLIQGYHYKIKN